METEQQEYQKLNEMSVNDENREEIENRKMVLEEKMRKENISPLPAFQQQTKKQFYFRKQNDQFLENKKYLKTFWDKFNKYTFECKLDNFDPFKMFLDLGLIYRDDKNDSIFHYRSWLWKYCEKRIDLIRQRSSTLAKWFIIYIIDSSQLTQNDF